MPKIKERRKYGAHSGGRYESEWKFYHAYTGIKCKVQCFIQRIRRGIPVEQAVLPAKLVDIKATNTTDWTSEKKRLDNLFYNDKDIIRNRSIILKLRPISEKEDFNSKIDFLSSCGYSLEHLSKVYDTVINPTYPSHSNRSKKD